VGLLGRPCHWRRGDGALLAMSVYVAAAWRQQLNAAYGGAVGGISTYPPASSYARSLSGSFAAGHMRRERERTRVELTCKL